MMDSMDVSKVMCLTQYDQLDKAVYLCTVRAETEPKHADKWVHVVQESGAASRDASRGGSLASLSGQ